MQTLIKSQLLSCLILLALGVLLIVAPAAALATYVRIIGAVLLVGAVFRFVMHFMTKKEDRAPISLLIAIVAAAFSLVLLIFAPKIVNVVNIIFGVLLILSSLLDLIISVRLPFGKVIAAVLSILGVLFGIGIIINPAAFANFITRITGGVLIYDAIVGLVTALLGRKTAKSNLLN